MVSRGCGTRIRSGRHILRAEIHELSLRPRGQVKRFAERQGRWKSSAGPGLFPPPRSRSVLDCSCFRSYVLRANTKDRTVCPTSPRGPLKREVAWWTGGQRPGRLLVGGSARIRLRTRTALCACGPCGLRAPIREQRALGRCMGSRARVA